MKGKNKGKEKHAENNFLHSKRNFFFLRPENFLFNQRKNE
jgi:hypothetical protein